MFVINITLIDILKIFVMRYLQITQSVTTCLVVLSSRFYFWKKKQAEATNPTTDRHGHDGPSQGLVSKHLENLKLGTENRLSELRNGMAGRAVTGVTDRHR